MDAKQEFFNNIHNHYVNISDSKVPLELVNELSEVVTNYYYEQYRRFWEQYPKSAKRYSTFQLKDLDHPTAFEMVIKYFKNKRSDCYRDFSQQLLNMSEEELIKFEKNREDFYKMW
jgi:hypothetical protein